MKRLITHLEKKNKGKKIEKMSFYFTNVSTALKGGKKKHVYKHYKMCFMMRYNMNYLLSRKHPF